ncbi:MAG: MTAP family purine nucleoside phosphorylase [Nitrososphaerota archaeon]|nr:MTAP family purine nucleoside phosphorylase [Nitrososphaerota archaeon]
MKSTHSPDMTDGRPAVGVIAGTGVTQHFDLSRPRSVNTRYGRVPVYEDRSADFVVISRHGPAHRTPPHAVNYRANIAALERLGVKEVIATSAVGSMNDGFKVGELGLAGQFLDFTKRRDGTFFENAVVHTDMTYPYSRRVNEALVNAARELRLEVREGLVYVCVEGPRFETAAEIKMYRTLGGDVVGMTGVPEVVLAKEKQMEYSSVLVATNWAAGLQPTVSHEEVTRVMERTGRLVKQLIEGAIGGLSGQ